MPLKRRLFGRIIPIFANSRARAFLPFAVMALATAAIFLFIVRGGAPTTASEWGSLLSALVGILGLGAFLTTILLQMDELSLQRQEITRLAAYSGEQVAQARRQSLIESYRLIDTKIEALFSSDGFLERLASTESASNAYLIEGLSKTGAGIHSFSYRGMHNLKAYRFVTEHHKFPIVYFELDSLGGPGDARDALLPLRKFFIMTGIADASGFVRHVYDLAADLDLLGYARSAMLHKTELEPALYIAAKFEYAS